MGSQMSGRATFLLGLLMLAKAAPVFAGAASDSPCERGWSAFPAELVSRPYLSDPLQPRFGVDLSNVSALDIEDSGDTRFGLRLGGRFGLVRYAPGAHPERPWQLDIEAGFYGQFDIDQNQDNLAWDGIYGLVLAKRMSERLDLRVALRHFSSHIGDEFEERTGRQRINYTREESLVGIAWKPVESWRLYWEAAWGHELRDPELQEPGRGQAGVEYRSPRPLFWRFSGYSALNLNAFEESEWKVDTTLQIGLSIPAGSREWRTGIEYYDGRVPLGQFFQARERWISLGLWLDL
jgi:hypothetical protein